MIITEDLLNVRIIRRHSLQTADEPFQTLTVLRLVCVPEQRRQPADRGKNQQTGDENDQDDRYKGPNQLHRITRFLDKGRLVGDLTFLQNLLDFPIAGKPDFGRRSGFLQQCRRVQR